MPPGSSRPHLSVVIPAYNEEDRLGRSLPLIHDYLTAERIDAEVLVIDDGSADATAQVAGNLLRGRRGRVLRHPDNRGKGHALRRGALAAEGRWLLFTDADLSTPIEEHAKLAAAVRDRDLDGAIGSRALADSRIEVRQTWVRQSMGKTFNRLMRWITGLSFRDTQCGFKLFDRERTRLVFERMVVDGFAADVELLLLCTRFGLRVQELPVRWRNDPSSRVRLLSSPARMLFDVARVRWRFARGAYDAPAALADTGRRGAQ